MDKLIHSFGSDSKVSRRTAVSNIVKLSAVAGGLRWQFGTVAAQPPKAFQFRFLLAGCMYGYTQLETILAEVKKTSAVAIDLWPKPHGDQCEQLADMGEAKFAALLKQHQVTLGCVTRYDLGPFQLHDEFARCQRLGCQQIVTGAKGPKGLQGNELKTAVSQFLEQLKPHLELAAQHNVTLAIENHAHSLIESVDSIRYLAEFGADLPLKVALAPYHLPQDSKLLGSLLRDIGKKMAVFYAWQHGLGCMQKLPKEEELLQMPGRGNLDFQPLVAALRDIQYTGWTEIFMHPVPRGIPILDSTAEVTDEINRAKLYLLDCVTRVSNEAHS